MYCLTCSYKLASLRVAVCPECGRAFERDDPSTFDSRTRSQRLLLRVATSLLIAVLCFGVMTGATWIASHLAFSTFHRALVAYVSVGVACAAITAVAAACIPSRIARAILFIGGVLSMWPTLLLGVDRGYRVWQAQPDAPEEAYADGGPALGAIFLGWIPSAVWWLMIFGIAMLLIPRLRRSSSA
jgi:hypothetical protein